MLTMLYNNTDNTAARHSQNQVQHGLVLHATLRDSIRAANYKPLTLDVRGRPTLYFVATRALETGEELPCDYGERRAGVLDG